MKWIRSADRLRCSRGRAAAGGDYTGPTTGSVTLPKNTPGTSFTVPLVFDGFNEPTEQFTVRLTSSSVPADITDTGTGTILDGTQIPADCTVSLPSEGVMALDCTGRPAGQQWRLQTYCFPFGRLTVHYGNIVTGNGQSTVDCSGTPIAAPYFRIVWPNQPAGPSTASRPRPYVQSRPAEGSLDPPTTDP